MLGEAARSHRETKESRRWPERSALAAPRGDWDIQPGKVTNPRFYAVPVLREVERARPRARMLAGARALTCFRYPARFGMRSGLDHRGDPGPWTRFGQGHEGASKATPIRGGTSGLYFTAHRVGFDFRKKNIDPKSPIGQIATARNLLLQLLRTHGARPDTSQSAGVRNCGSQFSVSNKPHPRLKDWKSDSKPFTDRRIQGQLNVHKTASWTNFRCINRTLNQRHVAISMSSCRSAINRSFNIAPYPAAR
jgi:hypothetical protein